MFEGLTLGQLLIAALLGGVAMLVVAKLVPGMKIKGGFGTAVGVAVVYGLLKALLQGVLIGITAPLVLITLGLFIIVINAFLLWLTSKVVDDFEVKSTGALVVGAFLLSVMDILFRLLGPAGAIF